MGISVAVPRWTIGDPANPQNPANVVAYPAAGTTNAEVSLSLLGLDHLKLTYPYLGRNFRLTDVGGKTDLVAKLRKG